MMHKRLITISIVGGVIVLFGISATLYLRHSAPSNAPLPSMVLSTSQYVQYDTGKGTIKMKDFTGHAVRTLDDGTAYIADTDTYGIFYTPTDQTFHITLLNQPVAIVRKQAERAFLQLLDINSADACKLKIYLTGPVSVDERFGDQPNFGLSFCPGSKPL